MPLTSFHKIEKLAAERKGGKAALEDILKTHDYGKSARQLAALGDDRYLSMMTRCIFQAGFNWKVIDAKWKGFEEAFHGFNPKGLAHLSPEKWDMYTQDKRIVRNPQKIKSVLDNAHFVWRVSEEKGSFGKVIANWPATDQIGLMAWLAKEGSRLGGRTAGYFLRFIGKDCFILSRDLIARLQASGVEIAEQCSSKRDLRQVQETLNRWQEETGYSYTRLSRIAAMSIGANYQLTPEPDE